MFRVSREPTPTWQPRVTAFPGKVDTFEKCALTRNIIMSVAIQPQRMMTTTTTTTQQQVVSNSESNNENNNPLSTTIKAPIKKRPLREEEGDDEARKKSNLEATTTATSPEKNGIQNTVSSSAGTTTTTTIQLQPSSTPATTMTTIATTMNTTTNTTTRICSRCTCLASCAWHKSKTQPNASLCETCYRVEALELVDKKCHSCETTKTSRQWYKSKITVGDLCKRCYRIELVALQHKTCIACSSKTTSGHWYKSKLLPDGDLCNNCYGKVSARARSFIFISAFRLVGALSFRHLDFFFLCFYFSLSLKILNAF